GIIGM
ncbi:hypothetical protein D041_4097B, partial [Vibrio parahaemolyticus EKP-008]